MKEKAVSVQFYTDAVRFHGGKESGLRVTVLPDSRKILGLIKPSKVKIGELIEVIDRYIELAETDERPFLNCTQDVLYKALKNPENIGVHTGQEDF